MLFFTSWFSVVAFFSFLVVLLLLYLGIVFIGSLDYDVISVLVHEFVDFLQRLLEVVLLSFVQFWLWCELL